MMLEVGAVNKRIIYRRKAFEASEYLDKIKSGAKWLDSQEKKDQYGIMWQYNDSPDAVEYYTNIENFNSGSSGMIPYLLSVFDVTGDEIYLEKAIAVGDRLIATKDAEHVRNLGNHLVGFQWSIYGGLPGEAATAIMLYEKTGIERFKEFALDIADEICESAVETERGVEWIGKEIYSVGGDAGAIMYLLYASRHLGIDKYKDTIRKGAYQLIAYGQKSDKGGKVWLNGISPERSGFPVDMDAPGIEFGTAGMAWFFAEVSEYLGDQALLEEALAGAEYIRNISTEVAPNAYLVYCQANIPDLYYLGNCMGAAGVIKMFYRLYQITKDEIHKDWIEKYVNGILSTGAPMLRSPGYWNNACVCCGTSGLLRLFLGLWAAFGDDEYMLLAEDAADTLIADSFNDDQLGVRWYHAFERVSPMKVHTHTGFMCGNAGSITALAEFYLAKQGKYHSYRFIEDPIADKVLFN